MPYYLVKTNGDALVTIEDGTIDTTTTDLTLIGKNYPTFGLALNQNFVKLVENFANTDQPSYPQLGQLWYDTTNKNINLLREGSVENYWKSLSVINSSGSEPAESQTGDLWFDTLTQQLKVYSGSLWVVVGPQTTTTGLLRVTGNNSFVLQIGGTDVLTVDPLGNVTKPLSPVLQAIGRASNTDFTTTNISTYQTWIPAIIDLDSSGSFNSGLGIYTCPVDGYYRVFFSCTTQTSGAHSARWQLNEIEYGIDAYNTHTTGSHNMTCSGIITASAGDEIKLVCSTDSGASISYQNASYSIELIG